MFSVEYPRAEGVDVTEQVEQAVTEVQDASKEVSETLVRFYFELRFYSERSKSGFFGMQSREKITWERWYMSILADTTRRKLAASEEEKAVQRQRELELDASLRKAILGIASSAASYTSHVPRIEFKSKGSIPFGYEVLVPETMGVHKSDPWMKRFFTSSGLMGAKPGT